MKRKSMWISLLMAGAVGLGSANVLIPDSVSPARKALLAEKRSELIEILEEQCEEHEVAALAAGFEELKEDMGSSSKLNRSRIYENTHHAIAYLHHAMDKAETSTPTSGHTEDIAQSYSEASEAEDTQGDAANVEYARASDRVYKEDYKDALQELYDIEELLAPEYAPKVQESTDSDSESAAKPRADTSSNQSAGISSKPRDTNHAQDASGMSEEATDANK
ncbi:MAG: hypothetical protein KDK33_01465 [Leptospiraceae bacterium]|nr:hypothetical protein [Leptospiraceae bacterium]